MEPLEVKECKRARLDLESRHARTAAVDRLVSGEDAAPAISIAKKKQAEKERLLGAGIPSERDPVLKGPSHLYRDPNVPLKAGVFRRNSFNCAEGRPDLSAKDFAKIFGYSKPAESKDGPPPVIRTRAEPVPMDERGIRSHAADGSYQFARRECQFALEAIQKQFLLQLIQPTFEDDGSELGALRRAELEKLANQAGVPKVRRKFFDNDFFLGSRANLYPEGAPKTCTIAEPEAILRTDDVWPGLPLFDTQLDNCEDRTIPLYGHLADFHVLAAVGALMQQTREETLLLPLPSSKHRFSATAFGGKTVDAEMSDPFLQHEFMNSIGNEELDATVHQVAIGRQHIKQLFVIPDPPDMSQYPPGTPPLKDFVQEVGCVGVLLYRDAVWSWVIVDTTIPVDEAKQPLFCGMKMCPWDMTLDDCLPVSVSNDYDQGPRGRVAGLLSDLLRKQQKPSEHKDDDIFILLQDYLSEQLEDPSEIWPALLEKAFAKFLGSFDAIDGGAAVDALITMSGGTGKTFYLDARLKAEAQLENDEREKAMSIPAVMPTVGSSQQKSKGVGFSNKALGGRGFASQDPRQPAMLGNQSWDVLNSFEAFQDLREEGLSFIVTRLNPEMSHPGSHLPAGIKVSLLASDQNSLIRKITFDDEFKINPALSNAETVFLRQGYPYVVTDVWRREDGAALVELFSPWGPVVCPTAKELITRTKRAASGGSGGALQGMLSMESAQLNEALGGGRRGRNAASPQLGYKAFNDDSLHRSAFGDSVHPTSGLANGQITSELEVADVPVIEACYAVIRFEAFRTLFGKIDLCEVIPRSHIQVEASSISFGTTVLDPDTSSLESSERSLPPLIFELYSPLKADVLFTMEQQRRIFNPDVPYPMVRAVGYNKLALKVSKLRVENDRQSQQFKSFVSASIDEMTKRPKSILEIQPAIEFAYPARSHFGLQVAQQLLLEPGRYLVEPFITSGPAVRYNLKISSNPLTVLTLYELNPLAGRGACTMDIPRKALTSGKTGPPTALIAGAEPGTEGSGADWITLTEDSTREPPRRGASTVKIFEDEETEMGKGNRLRKAYAAKGMDIDVGCTKAFEDADVLQKGKLDSRGLQRAAMEFFLRHTPFGQVVCNVIKEMKANELLESRGGTGSGTPTPSNKRGRRRSSIASGGPGSSRGSRRSSSIQRSSIGTAEGGELDSPKPHIVMDKAAFERLMLDSLKATVPGMDVPSSPVPISANQSPAVQSFQASLTAPPEYHAKFV